MSPLVPEAQEMLEWLHFPAADLLSNEGSELLALTELDETRAEPTVAAAIQTFFAQRRTKKAVKNATTVIQQGLAPENSAKAAHEKMFLLEWLACLIRLTAALKAFLPRIPAGPELTDSDLRLLKKLGKTAKIYHEHVQGNHTFAVLSTAIQQMNSNLIHDLGNVGAHLRSTVSLIEVEMEDMKECTFSRSDAIQIITREQEGGDRQWSWGEEEVVQARITAFLNDSANAEALQTERSNGILKHLINLKLFLETFVPLAECDIEAQLALLGAPCQKSALDMNELAAVLKRLESPFRGSPLPISVRPVYDEAAIDPNLDGAVYVRDEGGAAGRLNVHMRGVIFSLYQAVKNAVKVNAEEKLGSIVVSAARDEAEALTRISVSNRGVGFSYDGLRAKFTEEALRRMHSATNRSKPSMLDRLLSDPRLRDHVPPVLLHYFLLERGRSFNGGTGLGLNMLHRITTMNGGYVEAGSNPETGATVSMVFPDTPVKTPDDERAQRVLRFNTACRELATDIPMNRTLVGRFFDRTENAWVEIVESTPEETAEAETLLSRANITELFQPALPQAA